MLCFHAANEHQIDSRRLFPIDITTYAKVRGMWNTRLIIRLIGVGEARAEGLGAAVMLTALAVLAMALVVYTSA